MKQDYITEANATCSNSFHGANVSKTHFANVLKRSIMTLQALDDIKKSLFYGRELKTETSTHAGHYEFKNHTCNSLELYSLDESNATSINILHGIIGIATEAGELLEALYNAVIRENQADLTNIAEEIGDVLWYQAVVLKAINSNFETEMQRNIAKLRKRFPNAFNEHDANNRDLFSEREILEQKPHRALGDIRQAWECKIGSINGVAIPNGGDAPMRQAVETAYLKITGQYAQACFSGWGAEFDEKERAVIENRLPREIPLDTV